MTKAQAAWLNICPGQEAPQDAVQAAVMDADGKRQGVTISDETGGPACQSFRLAAPAHAIAAIRPISPALAASIGDTLVLTGSDQRGRFTIGEVTNGRDFGPKKQASMPLRTNLLADMIVRTFGSEERALANLANGRLELQCRGGDKPAGVILGGPWHMPEANVRLQVSGSGSGRFELQAADVAGEARESAKTLGYIDAARDSRTILHPFPREGFDRSAWRFFAIACPAQDATLLLEDVRLQPNSRSVAARSGWIWNPRAWQDEPEEVFAHARKYGIKTLFISVPQTEGRIDDADQLSSFIHAAARRDVEVWAVDGDPQMVVPGEHAATIRRMRAYAAYNAAVPVAARLRGVQFDIEPYLLPGYDVAAADWDRRYLELVRGLHAAAGALPLEMVVPFWWSDKAELLKSIAPYISGLSVMDYRTQPDEIRRFAIPFLDWGAVHGKQVRIALEAGPVEGEQHRRYTRSSSGELWLVQAGQAHFIILLKEPGSNPAGAAFRFSASWTSDGSTTSFRSNPGRLIGLLPALEQDFSAWDSFRGMALHELK